ncbi:hypothetical protein DND132_2088 [Pseudodesulfovibrio mercurii]|uniref:Uncharacterized protein n=1 Tax=Pseudodesulfovibrio mercurii TaxID=641491 RepID=F0JHQ7_9BACT|nr:hypothetical protein [Pseudodesulfovibrio mercurii]EGB15293.1 hypothetical protein DND132_2088 [Pseudodesulfovibrio mercurii]
MPVTETTTRPDPLAHFPENGPYRWLELADADGPYGVCAIAPRPDYLELHLTMSRWGPATRRTLAQDLEWLKTEAKRLHLPKIMGVRANDQGQFDNNLFRFARLYGFSDMCVFQTASLTVD